MNKTLCIYHGNCADGFTAAWIVREALGEENVEFFAGIHGETPPDVKGRDVIIVDFSYKRPAMEQMVKDVKSLVVLDHHKSAKEDLDGLQGAEIIFDMERSGAMITWDYCYNDHDAPALVKYVQDRDLWKFELEGTKEYQACVFSYEYTFENWDMLAGAVPADLIAEGKAIMRKQDKDIAEFIAANKERRIQIGGFSVPVINVPYTLGSDTCHILSQGEPFAAYYYDLGDKRLFGLRSSEDGEDVSVIASSYGGGGHKHASGFSRPLDWMGEK